MTTQKNKRRQLGGTVKAAGLVPDTATAVCVGGFQNNNNPAAGRSQKLRDQAAANREIAKSYALKGDARMAAFWLGQAQACEQAMKPMARPSDRVTDGIAAFYQRLRAASPRQRRLKALQELKVAHITETVRSLMGGLMLVGLFILFSIL